MMDLDGIIPRVPKGTRRAHCLHIEYGEGGFIKYFCDIIPEDGKGFCAQHKRSGEVASGEGQSGAELAAEE